jgi:hypothetical protein
MAVTLDTGRLLKLVLAALLAVALSATAVARVPVGTCTQAYSSIGNIRLVTLTCTADAAAATFPSTDLTTKIEGRLLKLVTNPGATAPQDNYDLVLNDQHGADVLQGVGANRHTTTTQEVAIVYSGTGTHPVVDEQDTLTLVITGNNVNSAITVVSIYYAMGG